MSKPKGSVRELMEAKQKKIREREENFRKKFEAAPKAVQDAYRLCSNKINELLNKRHPKKLLQPFEKVLYAPGKGSLTEEQIVQLQGLLKLDGWNIVLTAPLEWRGKGRRPIGLLFRYHEDD